MHIVTHLLVGWNTGAAAGESGRDLALVSWAGVLPDLDGLGLLVDVATRKLGMAETDFYAWHHVYGHGLPATLVIAAACGLAARRKWRTAALALLTAHLHLLGDVFGSRGSRPEDIWEISYLAPISNAWQVAWAGQWHVMGWQNTVITAALLGLALAMAVWRGVSPVGLLSAKADAQVVATLRARWHGKR